MRLSRRLPLKNLKQPLPRLLGRIVAVNVLPLLILGLGLLYLGRYEERLLNSAVESLQLEGRIFASALAEGAVLYSEDEHDMLSPELSRQMVRRLVETTSTRTRLLNKDAEIIADTRLLMGPGGEIEVQPLPPPKDMGMSLGGLSDNLASFMRFSSFGLAAPERAAAPATDLPVLVQQALDGIPMARAFRLPDGRLQLEAAVPVQKFRRVLGTVWLARDGNDIQESVRVVRVDILRLFFFALFITVLLSLYLAQGIAAPLQRLALAANTLRRGTDKGAEIPDFSARHDEIGDLSSALRAMTLALQERMNAIEGFAADVAHELKNPLSSLRSAVETLGRVSEPSKRERLLAVIDEDVRRLDRLITDIANASRLDAELGRAATDLVDLAALLNMAHGLYDATAEEGGALTKRVRAMLCAEPIFVLGMPSRLLQVLQNLIDNALSFSPADGFVQLRLWREGENAFLSVEDFGPGIPLGKEEAIFSRFYTERPAGEKFGQHSGLGLSIARQIAEAHRGRLFAENRRDDAGNLLGARFILSLPLAPMENEKA